MKNQISRRNFIKQSLITTTSLSLGASMLANCNNATRKLTEIGLQVLTIKPEIEKDYIKALEQVAEIGYHTLEMGNFYGPSLVEFKNLLQKLGLKVLAGGGAIGNLQTDLDKMIQDSHDLGKKYLLCYWPWTDSPENKTLDDWKRMAESLNHIGKKVKQAGLVFGYHNHDLEFKITEGQIPYNIILDNTDPDLVAMQIDLYWIKKGNQEPIPYFEKYPGRFPLWHVKDMDNTPERSFACVGQGIIDFPAIFAKADLAGMQHLWVEHDKPENPMECARVSFEYLKNLRY
ncbi:sugar phosphate isomerase/epimerase [candidate division KSB1 bacterium]|nr:sugar phosphate isomerase/epimerase [candidate division KSB1 bacterium]